MARALFEGAGRDALVALRMAVSSWLCWVAFVAVVYANAPEAHAVPFPEVLGHTGGIFLMFYVMGLSFWPLFSSFWRSG